MRTVDPGRVAALHDEGLSLRKIGKVLGCSHESVRRALRNVTRPVTEAVTDPNGHAGNGQEVTDMPPPGLYDLAAIEGALAVVAACAGNTKKAAKWLNEDGHPIPEGTLTEWRDRLHRDRYREIRDDVQDKVRSQAAIQAEDLASTYAEVEHKALARLNREMPRIKAERLGDVAYKAAVGRGISLDKAERLRDRPTAIVEHRRDASDILKSLNDAVPGLFVDGIAVEEPETPELPPAA